MAYKEIVPLSVRAQSLLQKVPRTLTYRREHEGPWQVSALEIHDQGDLEALVHATCVDGALGHARILC